MAQGHGKDVSVAMRVDDIDTPALLLDRARLESNLRRMNTALRCHNVDFRPHLKTAKSLEIARLATSSWSGSITVSTLKEAETFAEAGFSDILYAVGIAPGKLAHAARLLRRGTALTLVVDSLPAAAAVAEFGAREGLVIPVLIEIDADNHRAGVKPTNAEELLAIGRHLDNSVGTRLAGVMAHAGGSYEVATAEGLASYAELERANAVSAAELLRSAGIPCAIVSVGSTPTALFARALDGVTEVRAGVYMFFDLVMAGIGVCRTDEIALSVLTAVIGHQRERNQIIVDAGWMALSRDRGTQSQAVDQGYGLVCDANGQPMDDLVVVAANQEHGLVADRQGRSIELHRWPIGTLLRILPNHACATAGQHDRYHVMNTGGATEAVWPRFGGW